MLSLKNAGEHNEKRRSTHWRPQLRIHRELTLNQPGTQQRTRRTSGNRQGTLVGIWSTSGNQRGTRIGTKRTRRELRLPQARWSSDAAIEEAPDAHAYAHAHAHAQDGLPIAEVKSHSEWTYTASEWWLLWPGFWRASGETWRCAYQ